MAPAPNPDDLLRQLAQEGGQGVYGADLKESTLKQRAMIVGQAERGGVGPKRMRYSHADCVDRLLASPGISNRDLAQVYGVTEAWISIVINCDAFKATMADRKAELVDPVLAASLNERFGALAARSVEVLLEKLHKPVSEISDKLALEAAALGAKAVGMGETKPSVNAVDHLAALSHRLLDLNRPAAPTVDAETRVIE